MDDAPARFWGIVAKRSTGCLCRDACLVTNCGFNVRLRFRQKFAQCDKSGPKREELGEAGVRGCFSNSDSSAPLRTAALVEEQ